MTEVEEISYDDKEVFDSLPQRDGVAPRKSIVQQVEETDETRLTVGRNSKQQQLLAKMMQKKLADKLKKSMAAKKGGAPNLMLQNMLKGKPTAGTELNFEGDQSNSEEDPEPEPMDYSYLNGLRGIGALCVYFHHFVEQFFPLPTAQEVERGEDIRHLPDVFRTTPLMLFQHGYFWVLVFFILSGFVLPLRFFKTGQVIHVQSGTFKRYLRLMLPLVMILSLYYLFMKLDAMGPYTFQRIKGKQFMHVIIDGCFGTWIVDDSWSRATWTLSIELCATFLIYLLAQTAVQYRQRYWIYFAVCIFIWIPQITDKLGLTKLDFGNLIIHLPVFFIGTILADFETMKDHRPLDKLRNLNTWWKIPINVILVLVIISLGSYTGNGKCLMQDDGSCEYWSYATFNFQVNKLICNYLAAISLILFALTSPWLQWILASAPLQFLGSISYCLYIVHELFTEWAQVDAYYSFLGQDIDPNLSILYVWLIFTPVLILVAWILTLLVDNPSKKFASQLDLQVRKDRVPPPKSDKEEDQDPEEYYGCWNFTKRSWTILAFVVWLILVMAVTEIYTATKDETERPPNDVPPALTVASQRFERI